MSYNLHFCMMSRWWAHFLRNPLCNLFCSNTKNICWYLKNGKEYRTSSVPFTWKVMIIFHQLTLAIWTFTFHIIIFNFTVVCFFEGFIVALIIVLFHKFCWRTLCQWSIGQRAIEISALILGNFISWFTLTLHIAKVY